MIDQVYIELYQDYFYGFEIVQRNLYLYKFLYRNWSDYLGNHESCEI
jgi:hypothetical protein